MEIFVSGNTVELPLDEYGLEGHYIEVKERLTYGEEQRVASAGLSMSRSSDDVTLDLARMNTVRIATWVTDWSFQINGKRAKVTRETIESLNPKVVEIIDAALSDHIERVSEGNVAEPIPIETAKK